MNYPIDLHKSIKNALLFFVLFCIFSAIGSFSNKIVAQSPGYQGKHIYINYEPIVRFDNLYYYDDSGDRIEKDTMFFRNNFSLKHNIGLHYIFSRTDIVGLDISLGSPRNFIFPDELTNKNKLYRGTGRTYGINYKHFNFGKKGFIAPNGNFIEVRPFLYTVKVEEIGIYFPDSLVVPGLELPYPDFYAVNPPKERENDRFNSLGISVSWGMQTVWWDRVIPSYVLGLTVIPNFILNDDFLLSKEAATFWMGGGLLQRTYIDVKVGVGILLF